MKYKLYRDKFLSLFLKENLDEISFEDFDTQKRTELGQPDINISTDSFKIFIEVKVNKWTVLTPNQPDGYIKELSKEPRGKEKWLIFLVPRGYENENYILSEMKKYDDNINHKIIYWESIIDIIKSSELDKLNPIFKNFVNLLEDWYIPRPIIFEWEEIMEIFSDEIPQGLKKLRDLVNDVVKKMTPERKVKWSGTGTFLGSEYGVYFYNSKNQEVLFFGIWFDFWENQKKPLCFGVYPKYPKEVIDYFRNRYSTKIKVFNNWEVSWFDENIFFAPDNTEVIQKELEQLLNEINKITTI
jgi:hypothetical protein